MSMAAPSGVHPFAFPNGWANNPFCGSVGGPTPLMQQQMMFINALGPYANMQGMAPADYYAMISPAGAPSGDYSGMYGAAAASRAPMRHQHPSAAGDDDGDYVAEENDDEG
eukprot:GHVU01133612.1.p1 GENE.GHVU01133612.1~~GHVU01133612.1.p1  ORF type:complete len:111 (+),score=8.99 GHVU01133612.1:1154-1486(+)